MSTKKESNESHRLAASDDLEVSAYLEIAKEKAGQAPVPHPPSRPERESIIVIDFGSQ